MKCGIVDVGSNTVQLSVYQYEDGSFQLLLNRWETVGLMGYVEKGALNEDGVRSACRVLEQFKALLDALDISALHVFATASLRNISNTDEVVAAIRARTGIAVEILSGETEAECSFRGAMLENSSPSGMMVDIGGGSTELVTYRDGAMVGARSLPMGALSLYKKHVGYLFPDAQEWGAIHARVSDELGQAGADAIRCAAVTGVGGTVRAVVKLCNTLAGAEEDRHMVAAGEVHALITLLSQGDKRALDLILRAVPERIHTLIPGLMILDAVLLSAQAETLTVSESGVREGYLLSRVMGQ